MKWTSSLIDEIRNLLFGIPNAPGTDLVARDIQRARDDGIGTYNQVRVAYGLPAVTSFAEITSNVAVQQELQATYGTVDKIDPFEGMLAEDHLPGADVGPTDQGDPGQAIHGPSRRRPLLLPQRELHLRGSRPDRAGHTLAKVIEHNTGITNLQSNVFFFKVSITGTVFDGVPTTQPGGTGRRHRESEL